ncbi:MAG: glycoside hydrolase family protein [Anaerolineae bacterium]
MLYRPSQAHNMWDTWLYYHEGTHYLFTLHQSQEKTPWDGISLATSRDGVHFEEQEPIIAKRPEAAWLGTGSTWRAGEQFVLNFSEDYGGVQAIFMAVSDDLLHWERLGDAYRCGPDPRWYDNTRSGRWDCIWALPRAGGGCWGYLTARPWSRTPGVQYESVGMVESADGLHWQAAAPPDIDWGARPRMDVHEVGAVEEIDGRYYMLLCYDESKLGNRHASYTLGARRGMYTFIADNPRGPFGPDYGAYRLLTSNAPGSRMAHFCRFYRTPGDLLVIHHAIERSGHCWLAPLKRAVVDAAGNLRLAWWPGNEALKGESFPVDLVACRPVWPLRPNLETSSVERLAINEPNGGALLLLDNVFDLVQGLVLEAEISITPPDKRWGGVGLYIESDETPSRGTAFLLETRGCSEIGPLKPAERGWGYDFLPDDMLEHGIQPGGTHHLRLLTRRSLAELYLDERLVQCYSLPETATGRIGLVLESGRASFAQVKAWQMNLDAPAAPWAQSNKPASSGLT